MNDAELRSDLIRSYIDLSRSLRQFTTTSQLLFVDFEEGFRNLIHQHVAQPNNSVIPPTTPAVNSGIRQRFRSNLAQRGREATYQRNYSDRHRPISTINTSTTNSTNSTRAINNALRLDIPRFLHRNNTMLNLQNLSPIIVRPTLSQVARSTQFIRFESIERPPNTSCPIIQEDFTSEDTVLRINHCGHIFNYNALMRWFDQSVRCPLCRYDIRDDEPSEPPRSTSNPPRSTSTPIPNTSQSRQQRTPRVFSNISSHLTNEISNSIRDVSGNQNPMNLEYTFYTQPNLQHNLQPRRRPPPRINIDAVRDFSNNYT